MRMNEVKSAGAALPGGRWATLILRKVGIGDVPASVFCTVRFRDRVEPAATLVLPIVARPAFR